MEKKRLAWPLLLTILCSGPLAGQSWLVDEPGRLPKRDETGLRVEEYKDVAVSLKDLGQEALDLGLSRERIQSVVESRLRASRLNPVEYRQAESRKRDGAFLQVEVKVLGQAWEVVLSFRRIVVYTVVHQRYYQFGATTWTSNEAGDSPAATSVLQALERQLRIFVRDYLATN